MTVFAAAPGFAAHVTRDWVPSRGALAVEIETLSEGGSVIFSEATGHLPGLKGRLNPIRDTSDRTYLYASNIRDQRRAPAARPLPFRRRVAPDRRRRKRTACAHGRYRRSIRTRGISSVFRVKGIYLTPSGLRPTGACMVADSLDWCSSDGSAERLELAESSMRSRSTSVP